MKIEIPNEVLVALNNNSNKISYIEKLLSRPGGIFTVKTSRPLKMLKSAKEQGVIGTKISHFQARAGVNYENIKGIDSLRRNGDLPAQNSGLKGQEYLLFPYILKTQSEIPKYLFRFTKFNSTFDTKAQFFINSKEVKKEDLKEYCLAEEYSDKKSDSPVFSISIDAIEEVK